MGGLDKLEAIFERQKRFDAELERNRSLAYTKAAWVEKGALAMMCELAELVDEVNFKWWKNSREIDSAAVLEELADLLHFFVGTCIRLGFSAEELYAAYVRKNEENFRRQEGKSPKPGYAAGTGA